MVAPHGTDTDRLIELARSTARKYCGRGTPSYSDRRDFEQEAVLAALDAIPRFEVDGRPGESIEKYIGRVVQRHLKRLSRRDEADAAKERPKETLASVVGQGDQLAELTTRRVNTALESLSQAQLSALLMYRRKGLTQKDVAASMGISQQAASRMIDRAEKKIKLFFGPEVVKPPPACP